MIVIYTKNFPPSPYHGINIFGIVFSNRKWGKMSAEELRHEYIHTMQQKEMLFLFFYLWYVVEFFVLLVQHKGNWGKAYFNVSFEREAYLNMKNIHYKEERKVYSWVKYLWFVH